jgi:hypothetical protein
LLRSGKVYTDEDIFKIVSWKYLISTEFDPVLSSSHYELLNLPNTSICSTQTSIFPQREFGTILWEI